MFLWRHPPCPRRSSPFCTTASTMSSGSALRTLQDAALRRPPAQSACSIHTQALPRDVACVLKSRYFTACQSRKAQALDGALVNEHRRRRRCRRGAMKKGLWRRAASPRLGRPPRLSSVIAFGDARPLLKRRCAPCMSFAQMRSAVVRRRCLPSETGAGAIPRQGNAVEVAWRVAPGRSKGAEGDSAEPSTIQPHARHPNPNPRRPAWYRTRPAHVCGCTSRTWPGLGYTSSTSILVAFPPVSSQHMCLSFWGECPRPATFQPGRSALELLLVRHDSGTVGSTSRIGPQEVFPDQLDLKAGPIGLAVSRPPGHPWRIGDLLCDGAAHVAYRRKKEAFSCSD